VQQSASLVRATPADRFRLRDRYPTLRGTIRDQVS
jgi:hypothetical protein